MSDVLDIGRLATRIRSDDAEHAQQLAGQVRELADRQLARALDGAGERALARAGLPAGAVAAVERLDLHLQVAPGVPVGELARGWAGALEAQLARLLAECPPGDADPDATAVWFADPWAAELRHLERCAAGEPEAWWAFDLAGDGDEADPLAPIAILTRWLARNPPRAIATMAGLARHAPAIATRLTAAEADALSTALIAVAAARSHVEPSGPKPALPLGVANVSPPPDADFAAPADGLIHLAARLIAAATPAQARPWLAVLLLTLQPATSRLTADRLTARVAALAHGMNPPTGAQSSPSPSPSTAPKTAPSNATDAPGDFGLTPDATTHAIHAGGLLLLLRPLARLGLLPDAAQLGPALGDLALTALRRVLAPLPPGERAVAEERERPLLAVFAPECDWRDPINRIPVAHPHTAGQILDALVAAIPPDIAFAPGSLRQIFGLASPAFPTAYVHRLAALLLRPGELRVTPWQAELAWPLAAVDLALRRAGWDQDPGWLPWLGRSVRFRFGEAS